MRKVLKIDPNDVETLYEMATIYRNQNDNFKVSKRQSLNLI